MPALDRRVFLKSAIAATAAATLSAAETHDRPRLGVVVEVVGKQSPDEAIAHVKSFGLTTCQVHVGQSPAELAEPLKAALKVSGRGNSGHDTGPRQDGVGFL